jgi:hypothetical protein
MKKRRPVHRCAEFFSFGKIIYYAKIPFLYAFSVSVWDRLSVVGSFSLAFIDRSPLFVLGTTGLRTGLSGFFLGVSKAIYIIRDRMVGLNE